MHKKEWKEKKEVFEDLPPARASRKKKRILCIWLTKRGGGGTAGKRMRGITATSAIFREGGGQKLRLF